MQGDSEESAFKRRKLQAEGGDAPAAGDDGGTSKNAVGTAACLRTREKILAVERDYTHYFALDVGGEEGADQYVYQHFNTLCMVGIAPSSNAFAGGRKVTKVDFDVGRGGDKQEQKPSGKKKLGATYVHACVFVLVCYFLCVHTSISQPPLVAEALLLGLIRTHVNLSAARVSVCTVISCRPPSVGSSIPRKFDCTLLNQVLWVFGGCDMTATGPVCSADVSRSLVCRYLTDRGCRFLTETSRLCDLVCDDGTRIKVRCGIQGHLLEMNSRLKLLPDLINTKVHPHLTAAFCLCIKIYVDRLENVADIKMLPANVAPSLTQSEMK